MRAIPPRPTAPSQLLITRRRGEWFRIGPVVRVKVMRTDVRRQCDVLLQVNGRDHFLGGLLLADMVLLRPASRKHLGTTTSGYTLLRIPPRDGRTPEQTEVATWYACDDGRVPDCRFSVSRLGGEVTFMITAERHVKILRGELPDEPDPDPDGGNAARPLKPKPRGFWDQPQTGLPPRRRAA